MRDTRAIRLFWALPLGAAARRRAAGVAAALRGMPGGGDVRWVREESLHMTLRFLGAVDSARIAQLTHEVGAATRGTAPFAVELAGLHLFPSPRRPRVVALSLEPAAPLIALAAAVERGVVAAGFPAEPRPFRPHVTLGRVRDGRRFRLEGVAGVTVSVTAPGDAWDVMETVLFRSDLPVRPSLGSASLRAEDRLPPVRPSLGSASLRAEDRLPPGGARYTPLERVPLEPARAGARDNPLHP